MASHIHVASFFMIAFASYVEESSSSKFSETFALWMMVGTLFPDCHTRKLIVYHRRTVQRFGSTSISVFVPPFYLIKIF